MYDTKFAEVFKEEIEGMYDTEFAEEFKEEIELDEMKWAVGGVYHQEFKNGDKVYFRADSVQKNKRWKGLSVDEFGGRQKKAKSASADEKQQGWETTPKNEIPKGLKEEVEIDERDEWKNTRIQAKNIFKMLKQKHKNDIPKMKSGLELILKQNKTKPDQEKIMWQEFNKYFKIKEEVEIEEKKSATGYELYHKTFSDAMQHAYAHAKSKGFVVDPKEIDDKVATGPKKPSSGKTNRYSLKAGRKKVEIQVANLDNKRYELNMYIEEVELDEAFSM